MESTEETMKLYTVKEVSERLKVSHRTVLNWIDDGKIGAYKVGLTNPVIRISEAQVKEFLENHSTIPSDKADPHDNGE